MAETLMRYYDDRHLLEMLAKAKKSPKYEGDCYRRAGELNTDIFKALSIGDHSNAEDVLMNPYWNTWIRYVDEVAPDADKVAPLTDRFGGMRVLEVIASSPPAQPKSLEEILFTKWLGGPKV
ncbi:hypothetical protein GN244_ATG02085 [Phytophthora infestans]|uniref:Uncharacterized protein n=1 Tax=Phytophthora infestans TaxID=4787 RepID=A0A833WLZ9_PHYIN|nr:hypothetical protein GN244_ATG02085 [Phytophthora infestans]